MFLPAGTAVALLGEEEGARPEFARLDVAMSVRDEGPLLATTQWPRRARPSVERTRRVSLERDARSVLFFLPRWEWHGRGWWGRWDGGWDGGRDWGR